MRLRKEDIDPQRTLVHIIQGKVAKDRYTVLSRLIMQSPLDRMMGRLKKGLEFYLVVIEILYRALPK